MAQFSYRAANEAGSISKGQADAINELDLEAQLRNMGLQLVSAKLLASRKGSLTKMTRRDLIDFLFQLEMLSRAGGGSRISRRPRRCGNRPLAGTGSG